jgi:hypothetical protein
MKPKCFLEMASAMFLGEASVSKKLPTVREE